MNICIQQKNRISNAKTGKSPSPFENPATLQQTKSKSHKLLTVTFLLLKQAATYFHVILEVVPFRVDDDNCSGGGSGIFKVFDVNYGFVDSEIELFLKL